LEFLKKVGIYGGALMFLAGSYYIAKKMKKCIADFMFERELRQMESQAKDKKDKKNKVKPIKAG